MRKNCQHRIRWHQHIYRSLYLKAHKVLACLVIRVFGHDELKLVINQPKCRAARLAMFQQFISLFTECLRTIRSKCNLPQVVVVQTHHSAKRNPLLCFKYARLLTLFIGFRTHNQDNEEAALMEQTGSHVPSYEF